MKAAPPNRRSRLLSIGFALAAGMVSTGPIAEARIVRIEITSKESPALEGRTFGSVGAYEKLRGKAYGEVDPSDPRNAVIADIQLAPRNANGKVAYSMDIFILKPIDLSKGNGRLFIDVNNRGTMRSYRLNNGRYVNNPTKAADAGTGFLMNLGYAVAGNGWDIEVTPEHSKRDDHLSITVPIAKNPDGSPITGPSYEYINFDNAKGMRYELTYPAATLDKSKATLTMRARLDDKPTTIPASDWEYVNETTIRLLPVGTAFKQSHVYEFMYTAKDPVVAGLGLVATRDFVSFLRNAMSDDSGNPNPLAGNVQKTFSFAVSQSARYVNDFQTLGFNEDEDGRRVIDGVLNWEGGGSDVCRVSVRGQQGLEERGRS
jgi:hypothetical protein